jgi:ATP-dependent helicase/nuclease subunit A
VEFAAATLRDLRAMKDRLPIAQLIGEALARTGYDAVLLGEFLGQRKLANLRKLIEQARSFDRSGIFTLANFITQLSQFVAQQPDEALAATYPESADVVRLMTIHQAKGLEFPVVVVPDVNRTRRGLSSSVAFTRQLGPMVRDPNAPSGFDLYRLAEDEEEQVELVRLLYVATTRAADYLILSAGVPELGSAKGPWTRLISRRFDPLSGRMRVALPAGYPTPEIAVTFTEPPLKSRPSGGPVRRDLQKIVDKARQMAADGGGSLPEGLGPVPPDAAARRQYSFSRLSGKVRELQPVVQPELPAPDVPAEPPLDPRGLGTLVHAVLAEVDFGDPGDVAAAVRRHAPRHLPDVGDGLEEPIEMIGRFLASARARDMAAARQVYAELEFLLAWPPGAPLPDGRYLQGFIDCLYQDAAGAWRLVDYKTNRVTGAEVEAEAAQYEMQMLLYGLAVERILKCPPAELVLCFLRPGVEHRFSWNDSARQRAVDLVNQAMST